MSELVKLVKKLKGTNFSRAGYEMRRKVKLTDLESLSVKKTQAIITRLVKKKKIRPQLIMFSDQSKYISVETATSDVFKKKTVKAHFAPCDNVVTVAPDLLKKAEASKLFAEIEVTNPVYTPTILEDINGNVKSKVNKIINSLPDTRDLLKKDEFVNPIPCSYYYKDVSFLNYDCLLDTTCLQAGSIIHGTNELLNRSPGINTSMFYIGGVASVTAMHTESSDMSSMFYLISGAPKVWIMVAQSSNTMLQRMFVELDGGACAAPWEHNDMFIKLDTLDEHGIQYDVVIQRAGDFIVLQEGIFHQVLNLGPNFGESCNFAGPKWELLNRNAAFRKCFCRYENGSFKSKHHIMPSACLSNIKVVESKRKRHACPYGDCQYIFNTVVELQRHGKEDHGVKIFKCDQCDFASALKPSLLRHRQSRHGERKMCPCCAGLFRRLGDHIKRSRCSKKVMTLTRNQIVALDTEDVELQRKIRRRQELLENKRKT